MVFGKASGFAANLDLSSLDGSNGFVISGAGGPARTAGDLNHDGLDDLVIGGDYRVRTSWL